MKLSGFVCLKKGIFHFCFWGIFSLGVKLSVPIIFLYSKDAISLSSTLHSEMLYMLLRDIGGNTYHCSCISVPFSFFSFICISWRLITSQYCSGFCHTLTWISHAVTCIPHPDPPSHLSLHLIPLGLPSAPGPSICLMHPTWAGDLFHYR